MKSWVRERLKQINELFPAERVERSKRRWEAVWSGRRPEGRYPFVMFPTALDYYDDVFEPELGLRAYLDEIVRRGLVFDDDFIPALFPGCHQGAIPSMFGAKEIVVGADHTCERIIFSDADADSLPEPRIIPGTPAARWIEMERYYLEECESALPVHVCDMQGPFDVGGQLWGYDNLFLCAYDDEARFNHVMELCERAYCLLWETQAELLGANFVGTHLFGWDWVPPGNGATLSADSMAMMSPDFFDEYYAARLEGLAKRAGRLSVHSCGNFGAVAGRLAAIDGVQAVNASQMSVRQLLDAGWSAEKMIILAADASDAGQIFALAREQGLRLDVSFTGVWLRGANGAAVPPELLGGDAIREAKRVCAMVDAAARM